MDYEAKEEATLIEASELASLEASEAAPDPFYRHDASKRELAVRILSVGPGNSRDRLYYTARALEAAASAGAYNNVPVHFDHKDGVRGVEELRGKLLSGQRYVGNALYGRIKIYRQGDYDLAVEAQLPVSHRARVEIGERPITVGGHQYREVTAVAEGRAVDFVSAAGSAGSGVLASEASTERKNMETQSFDAMEAQVAKLVEANEALHRQLKARDQRDLVRRLAVGKNVEAKLPTPAMERAIREVSLGLDLDAAEADVDVMLGSAFSAEADYIKAVTPVTPVTPTTNVPNRQPLRMGDSAAEAAEATEVTAPTGQQGAAATQVAALFGLTKKESK